MLCNPNDLQSRHPSPSFDRLKGFDYSRTGAFFVTICAWQRECLFGEIVDGEMVLNDFGRVVQGEWEKTPQMRTNVELDVYSIMPNHFHAIFFIYDIPVGAHCMRPEFDLDDKSMIQRQTQNRAHIQMRAHVSAPLRRQSCSIGSIIAGFKSASTKRINIIRDNPGCPVWQRNYYERIIRDDNELTRACEYIVSNPMKWALDQENPLNCR